VQIPPESPSIWDINCVWVGTVVGVRWCVVSLAGVISLGFCRCWCWWGGSGWRISRSECVTCVALEIRRIDVLLTFQALTSLYQAISSTLRMEAVSAPETLAKLHTLTERSAARRFLWNRMSLQNFSSEWHSVDHVTLFCCLSFVPGKQRVDSRL